MPSAPSDPASDALQISDDATAHAVGLAQDRLDPDEAEPAILIEIDPNLFGGFARDRFDITIRGRVISPADIGQIALKLGEVTISTAFLGQPEREARNRMPDGTEARQRTFQFNLARDPRQQPEQFSFQIVARTTGGFVASENFTLDLDPTAETPLSIIAGPTRYAGTFGGIRPYAIMCLERGTVDRDGNLLVEGWAVALGPILDVQIFADDTRVASAALGAQRDDVGVAYPAYPSARLSGFSLAAYLDDGSISATTIRAHLICPNGFALESSIPVELIERIAAPVRAAPLTPTNAAPSPPFMLSGQAGPSYQIKADFRIDETPLLGIGMLAPVVPHRPTPSAAAPASQPAAQPSAEIKMYCDAAVLKSDGSLFLDGWALSGAGIAQIKVFLDDRDVGLARTGHERADVGAIYNMIPMASLSGFKFETRLDERFEGEHTIRIAIRNARNDLKEETLSVTVVPGSEQAAPAPKAAAPAPAASADPPPTPEQEAEFRFELDAPSVSNGVAAEMITGRLTIDGWLLSRSGIAKFQAFLGDQCLGDVHYGLARQDVGAAFPEWPNSLRAGYAFHCPPRSLKDGQHTVRLVARSKSGQEISRSFQITVKKAEDQQDTAGIRHHVPRAEADLMTALLTDLDYRPAYRFLLRQPREIDRDKVHATFASLTAQAFETWSVLILTEDADTASAMRSLIDDQYPYLNDRIRLLSAADSDAWNAPLCDPSAADAATLYSVLQTGDEIGADALLEFAVAGGMNRDADILYGDEVRLSPLSHEREPFFKPDFSPDLLTSTNYFGRPWVMTAPLLAKTGVTPASLLVDGEYDLVLRATSLAGRVYHVPKLLCQRSGQDLDDPAQEQAALERMLEREGVTAEVLPTPIPGTWRVKRAVGSKGKVSIIIPTCAANGYIETCIKTLRAMTAYPDYEIIVIDNIPESLIVWKVWVQQNADKIVDIPAAFNWSIFNNRATEVADGEYLLFLNDDIEITQADWLDAMMEHAQRPEVGITGPQLLYPDGKVQHAGMFLANNGIGRHAFRFASGDDPGYFGLALTQRNVMAVTGACLLVRKETFDGLGRFDEAHEITNNDLDFCLRVHKAGLLTVFTPYASLIHHELASRAMYKDVFDLTHFDKSWKSAFSAGDPYFNPRLSRHADDYRPDDEPVQWITPGAPLFHVKEIQRILVVKLDHIGDFVTALPPIRRLKQIFPHARLTVLAGPASRALASLEPSIDEFIPFAFFHARSQLGERKLEKTELEELQEKLRPYRFDLAVDLRKHLSTRDVLKFTGARFFAGFDYLGQFPFLDIALDWDGDRTLQRKRSHVVDDLLALVNAVGHATEANRLLMQPPPPPMPLTALPDHVQALFAKTVIAIHPGAGNVTKQWPPDHFSALMDLLIERQDVNIVLVGGPDEVEVADLLLEKSQHPGRVATMAGKTSLSELPRLLLNCALYIGNDSGPKHIASAIGMPTIGIHSGVVDPVEWGPFGPRAIALRRNMTCSPCYLANADDCPRSLACLKFLEPNLVYEAAIMLLKRPDHLAVSAQAQPAAAEPDVVPVMDMGSAHEAAGTNGHGGEPIPVLSVTPTPARTKSRNRRRQSSQISV
jgi:ADP-heptose:LPS heptosyltransferase/GT2 family glycosyltransferase